MSAHAKHAKKQLLHLVFGGELESLDGSTFKNLEKLHMVGMFPDYASAHNRLAGGGALEPSTNAHMRYFIVHVHKLLDPDADKPKKKAAKLKA